MDETQRLSRTIWIGVGLLIVICCLTFVSSRIKPVPRAARLPVIGPVADFALTNQDSRVVTLADLRGRVWVADIIFTRCAGPCPRMMKQMKELQTALPPESGVKLVTLTTDPEFDTPDVLKKYGTRYNLDPTRWMLLTGAKKEIAALAVDSLKLTALEKQPEKRTDADDLFIHSTIFVVVDKQARLRAAFETDGEGLEWTNVQSSIVAAVRQLDRER